MRNISGPIILVLISFSIHEEDTIKGCYAFILWKGNACIPFLERNLLYVWIGGNGETDILRLLVNVHFSWLDAGKITANENSPIKLLGKSQFFSRFIN